MSSEQDLFLEIFVFKVCTTCGEPIYHHESQELGNSARGTHVLFNFILKFYFYLKIDNKERKLVKEREILLLTYSLRVGFHGIPF